jgi:hypothetical protein
MSHHPHEVMLIPNENLDVSKLELDERHIHLSLPEMGVEVDKLKDIFARIEKISTLKILQIDLSDSKMADMCVDALVNCLKMLDLVHFHLNFSNVELKESQLEKILRPLYVMKNLRKLHFVFENVNMTTEEIEMLQECFKKLTLLKSARLNIRSNKNVSDTHVSSLTDILSNYEEHSLIYQ